jgi:hypothetical protein
MEGKKTGVEVATSSKQLNCSNRGGSTPHKKRFLDRKLPLLLGKVKRLAPSSKSFNPSIYSKDVAKLPSTFCFRFTPSKTYDF